MWFKFPHCNAAAEASAADKLALVIRLSIVGTKYEKVKILSASAKPAAISHHRRTMPWVHQAAIKLANVSRVSGTVVK